MNSPNETAGPALEKQLASASYDFVVIGGGLRLPPKSLVLFELVVNAVHKAAPNAKIAFNTRPEDTADAVARWLQIAVAVTASIRGQVMTSNRHRV